MTRRDVSTADLLAIGLCYDEVIGSLDASGGRITSTYAEALATMDRWAETTGRMADLQDGRDWLRNHFDETPPPPPQRVPFSSRTKFGSGRGNGSYGFNDQGAFMRVPRSGVAIYQNRDPGRGYGRA